MVHVAKRQMVRQKINLVIGFAFGVTWRKGEGKGQGVCGNESLMMLVRCSSVKTGHQDLMLLQLLRAQLKQTGKLGGKIH